MDVQASNVPQRETEFTREAKVLDERISDLSNFIDLLDTKISHILRKPLPRDVKEKVSMETQTGLGKFLRDKSEHINSMVLRMGDIIDRIEL